MSALETIMNECSGSIVSSRTTAIPFLALASSSGTAFAQDERYPTEPPLADSGWTAQYNELLLACYQGSMDACDRVASDRGIVF
jgi:hypothetical protein